MEEAPSVLQPEPGAVLQLHLRLFETAAGSQLLNISASYQDNSQCSVTLACGHTSQSLEVSAVEVRCGGALRQADCCSS